jgi:hypothetical protein
MNIYNAVQKEHMPKLVGKKKKKKKKSKAIPVTGHGGL